MSRTTAWSVHLAALAVGVTGLVYGWMRYLLAPPDELSVVNHPAQPLWQHLHVLVAPLLVFAVGLMWSAHAWQRVRTRFPLRRPSGLALFALFFPLALSGAWVQVAESEEMRAWAGGVHSAAGVAWCLAYGVHLALTVGLPEAVAHTAGAHSGEGELITRSLENTIVHQADYAYWHILERAGLLETRAS